MATDTRRRVKLYALNAERQWDDRGTGHVSSNYVERLKGISLLVRAESDGSLLLESKIQPDTAYQKQQDTLIVWSEGDNFDLALSFQEKAGCDEIWEKICQVQGKDPSVEITQDIVEESEDERFEEMSDSAPPIELPPCELARLEDISETIQSCITTPLRKEKLAMALENENYIKKLLNLFHVCEDLENTEGLHHLFEIFKNIFLLNKNALFEIMFADDTIFDVVGCLEYDPSASQPKRHRQYLKQWAKFREAVPIKNQDLLAKIHQTFRVQYIQDIILPAPSVFCEDNMLNTLSSFIFFNKVEIVTLIQEDERFLLDVFTLLTDPTTADAKRRDIVLFLKEFCNYAQNLQPQGKDSFYKTLTCLGILQALEITLVMNDQKTKSASIDILTAIVEFSPLVVRNYTLQQVGRADGDKMLINIAIEQMLTDSEPELGVAVQLMGIIKTLLEPDNMLTEKGDFLNFFYKHSIQTLISPLLLNTAGDRPQNEDYQTAQLLGIVLDILSFCVEHHTYHIKNFIIQKDLLKRILVLMKSTHTFLVLGALRLLRKIVALKDEFYNRHIVKSNLFAPVVDAFIRNNGRYNLLESAILELFEFIKLEDIRSLCLYFVENFSKIFDDIEYVQTFKYLKNRYDQCQDRLKDRDRNSMDSQLPIIRTNTGRFRRDQRQMEEEEEMWFNEDEDFADELETYNSVMKPVTEKSSLLVHQQKSPPQSTTQHTTANIHSVSNGSISNCTSIINSPTSSISPNGAGESGSRSPTDSSSGDSNNVTNHCDQQDGQTEGSNVTSSSHLEVAAAAAAAAFQQQHQHHSLQNYQHQQHIKHLSRTLAAVAAVAAANGVTSSSNSSLSCNALSSPESSNSPSSSPTQDHPSVHLQDAHQQQTNIMELQQQLAAVEKQGDESTSINANGPSSVSSSMVESAAVAVAATASQLLTIATAMAASCGAVSSTVLGPSNSSIIVSESSATNISNEDSSNSSSSSSSGSSNCTNHSSNNSNDEESQCLQNDGEDLKNDETNGPTVTVTANENTLKKGLVDYESDSPEEDFNEEDFDEGPSEKKARLA